MDKHTSRELNNIKNDVEALEKELDEIFKELRGKNNSLYSKYLTKNEQYKRAIEVSAQLLECYKFKNELTMQLESI